MPSIGEVSGSNKFSLNLGALVANYELIDNLSDTWLVNDLIAVNIVRINPGLIKLLCHVTFIR